MSLHLFAGLRVRDFRAGRREFFVTAKPGPKSAPAKEAARARIVALRRAGPAIIASGLTVGALATMALQSVPAQAAPVGPTTVPEPNAKPGPSENAMAQITAFGR